MTQIPLRYSLRNLSRRRTRTVLTVLGLGLAMAVIVFTVAFSRSLGAAARETGDPDNLIVISKRAQTHVLSSISANDCGQIRNAFYDEAVSLGREIDGQTVTTPPRVGSCMARTAAPLESTVSARSASGAQSERSPGASSPWRSARIVAP